MQFPQIFFLSPSSRAVLLMILSAACWGLGTVISKGILSNLKPLTVLVIQLSSSVTFLWTLTLIQSSPKDWQRLAPSTWLKLGFPGWLEPGLSYTFGLIGLTTTTASNAALIGTTEPVIILGLAGFLLKERIRPVLLGLSGIALCGVVLTIGGEMRSSPNSAIGDLLILIGTFCGALYAVLSRSGVAVVNALALAAIQQSFGLLWVILAWFSFEARHFESFSNISITTWAITILSGIVQYALAFWLYLQAIQKLPVSVAAQFLSLIPIFGMCGAYLFLGERLSLLQGLGGLLVIGAVLGIAQLQRSKPAQENPHES